MENLPPTTDALFQHARRAAYQASIWTTSPRTQQQIPAATSWDGNGMRVVEAGVPFGSLNV